MVLLAGLDLVICSEVIETVSISGQYRLQDGASQMFFRRYDKRPSKFYHLTLDGYFDEMKNKNGNRPKLIVPHYVGGSSQPVYPATEGYARAMLTIHKPWHANQQSMDPDISAVDQFHLFLKCEDCPASITIPYERMRRRHLEKMTGHETVAADMGVSNTNGIDKDIIEMLEIAATFNAPDDDIFMSQYKFERGEDYEWDKKPTEVCSMA